MPPTISTENKAVAVLTDNSLSEINLNEILQQTLQRIQKTQANLNMIVRCESLPFVQADKSSFTKLFDRLVNTIIAHPPTGTKLFLYVACEEAKHKNNSREGYKQFVINFHTNISTTDAWQTAHEPALKECASLLAQYGANFTVNEIKNAGCLFSIFLFGKL